jgi:uncharacterized protein (DUF2062 family)
MHDMSAADRHRPSADQATPPEPADAGLPTLRGGGPDRRAGWWRQSTRLARYRLVIPLVRSSHAPEHTARGVMIGLMWAMTPLVGIQMMMVAVTWVVTTRLFSWNFSLVLGLAWTWVTNAFTILPFYYGYYVTGQILLGHWDDISGFETFVALWEGTFGADMGFWQALYAYVVDIIAGWGLPLIVGSIPWVIVTGFFGYRLSLRVSRRHHARRIERRAAHERRKAQRRAAKEAARAGHHDPQA